jgi:hypothetical protein
LDAPFADPFVDPPFDAFDAVFDSSFFDRSPKITRAFAGRRRTAVAQSVGAG